MKEYVESNISDITDDPDMYQRIDIETCKPFNKFDDMKEIEDDYESIEEMELASALEDKEKAIDDITEKIKKVIKGQDNRKPEYVDAPEKKEE